VFDEIPDEEVVDEVEEVEEVEEVDEVVEEDDELLFNFLISSVEITSSAGVIPLFKMDMTTRRFFALFSGVVLGATGKYSPYPTGNIFLGSKPQSSNTFDTL
jgi:hypothetical protein